METFTIKDLEKFYEELFVSEGKSPVIIMTPELYEQYEKELVETIKEGDFSSYIPEKKLKRYKR